MELKLQKLFEALEKGKPGLWIAVGFITVALLGALDALTGNEISFSLFYLIPIVMVTWAVNQKTGLLMSFVSALTLSGAELATSEADSHPLIYASNTVIRIIFYSFVTYLVAALHKAQREEGSRPAPIL